MDSRPTYAILGSTGNCGTALLDNLLSKPGARIHAYCRNASKLIRLRPAILDDEKKVQIFEGNIQDIDLLSSCISGCRAVFLVVSTNDNIPGCRMARDATAATIEALRKLRREGRTTMPKLVLLSSSTIDDNFSRHMPYLLRSLLLCSAYYVYNDVKEAEKLIRAECDWLNGIYVKPGALSVDIQRGHALSLTDQGGPLSYLDLAAAMIEAADDKYGVWDGKNVSVVNTGGKAKFPSGTPLCILTGLLSYFFPELHPYLPSGTGPR
jgi:putative NADH-flavin reductase